MHLDVVVTWLLVGLMAGGSASALVKPGGYGFLADLFLGLAGSVVGIAIFHAVVTSPEAGLPVMAVVALAGAASAIAGQRWWFTHA